MLVTKGYKEVQNLLDILLQIASNITVGVEAKARRRQQRRSSARLCRAARIPRTSTLQLLKLKSSKRNENNADTFRGLSI
jgi:hypothetical protein